nr:integrase, catalytic region, zinc finger, CCHC-type, peptidase aspartic, catalytic [Tanacetum cinerariifolium]
MLTQQEIYAAGSKNRPPMLNKDNYVSWSSRIIRYARSRPNGKMIVDSIKNGPYVRRMIATQGEPDLPVPVPKTFHEQIDEELTENDIKRMDADDQANQTILLGLPEDVYAAVDSYETAKEIWKRESIESYYHRFMQLMNDLKRKKYFPKNIAANLKFLNNLQPEWKRHVTIVRQTKNLHEADFTQIYDFLKMNQDENDGNQNRLVVVLGIANQNGTSNIVAARAEGTGNGNQVRCYNCRGLGHIARNCTTRPRRRDAAYLQTQLLIAQKEEAGIQLQAEEFDFMAAASDLDEIEEEAQYTVLPEPIPEPQLVPHNDNHVTSITPSMVQSGAGSKDHPPMLAQDDIHNDDHAIPEHTTVETPMNMSPANKAHFELEKEAIHLMNEMIQNNLTVATMQVNVQFLQKLQPKWSRFVTIANQQHKLDEVSYHKLFDILKQYQKEVNELRDERLARNPNPLALVSTAQANQDPYYQTSKSYKSYTPSSKPSILTRSHTITRYKRKEIAKPITPPSESASKEDSDPEQAQRDKDMQNNLALIQRYCVLTARNLVKPKRVKDYTYHKEKMLLCKQAEKGVPLQAEKCDWLADTDEEIDEQELEAHYSYMAKIQEVPTADTCIDSEPLEQVQNDTGYNVFANDLQHFEQSESISNICLVETDDSNIILDSPDLCDDDIQNDQNDVESDDELLNEQALNVFQKEREQYIEIQDLKAQLQDKNIAIILGKPTPFLDSLERRYFSKTKLVPKTNELKGLSKPVTAQTLPQIARQAVSNTNVLKPGMYLIDNKTTQTRAPQSPQTVRNTNPRVSTSTRVNHKTNVSRPQHRSNQMKDKVVSNNSKVKLKKTPVEDHTRISSISNKIKYCSFKNDQFAPILGYEDLVQGNITINRVYYVEGLNHNIFSVGQLCDVDLEVAFRKSTCFVRDLQGNDLLTGNHGSDLYTISVQESTSSTPFGLMAKASPTQAWLWHRRLYHLNFDNINWLSKKDVELTLHAFFKEDGIKHQTSTARTPEQNCVVERRNRTLVEAARTMLSALKLPLFFWAEAIATACYTQNRSIIILTHDKTEYHIINDRKPLIKHLHIFGCICNLTRDGENLDKMKEKGDLYILASDYDNSDPVPQLQNVSSSADAHISSQQELDLLFGPLYDEFFTTEEEHLQDDEFTNPFCTPVQEVAESSSHNIDPKMCIFAFTVSIAEPENIKEAMADSAWIEAMQEELHQFDRLQEEVYVAQPDGFVDPDHPEKAKYTLEILHKHGMDKEQNIGTPMATKPKLDADLSGNLVDQTNYRSKIGSLMYLTSSRPDIVQAICYCARYQSRSTEKHLKEVKRIFRYLRGTVNMGL